MASNLNCIFISFRIFTSLGNVKEIIAQATSAQDQYMFQFDLLSQYMHRNEVPKETVNRVKEWCRHTWKTQKSFNELIILGLYIGRKQIDLKKRLDIGWATLPPKPCIEK